MGTKKMTQGTKKSEVFQKENIGHPYFGESGEMELKKDMKRWLPFADFYPDGTTSVLSATP